MTLLERDALLDALGARLAAARHGRGSIALVTGEAGAGKTSLVRAFGDDRAAPALILRGGCDPILPARPFAPVKDMADAVPGLAPALEAGDREAVFDRLLDVIRRPGAPVTLLVLEDLHWADEPTLDLLRVLGRRVGDLRALVIATFRDDEVTADHPLRHALGDLPREAVVELAVPPLSVEAVARLARERDGSLDARALHAASGGNAFFVTEAIQAAGVRVPATIRDAVGARAARLTPDGRSALDAAAVVGYPVGAMDLAAIAGVPPSGIEDCVRRGLLVLEGGLLAYRHELGRLAILDPVSPGTVRDVHRRALEVARAGRDPDAARLAGHAIGAGDAVAIRELAPAAADRAARLGAHREAASLYQAAINVADRASSATLAALLELHAAQASLADDVPTALASQRSAVGLWQSLGDPVREGDSRCALAMFLWLAGEAEAALAESRAAVEVLEHSAPDSPELARALGVLAQRLVVSNTDDVAGLAAGRRALELAETLGLEHVAVHALITIGVVEGNPGRDPDGVRKIEEAFRRASAAGIADEATRALINLLETAAEMWDLGTAIEHADRAEAWLASAAPQDLVHLRMVRTRRMQVDVDRGRWDAAVLAAEDLLALPITANQIRVRALISLGLVRARRGDDGATAALDEAIALSGPSEPQDHVPAQTARAEAAFLAGDLATARVVAAGALARALTEDARAAWWWWGHAAAWAWRSGDIAELPAGAPEPYVLEAGGDHRAAADAWAVLGFPYHEAVALSSSGDVADLRRALEIANTLGARPLARTLTGRLRALGAEAIPRGPRATTRGNPAGLTARELDIVRLLREGARNADIAAALTLSPKTVDHHVSAILHKLGVPDRAAAAREAARLGL